MTKTGESLTNNSGTIRINLEEITPPTSPYRVARLSEVRPVGMTTEEAKRALRQEAREDQRVDEPLFGSDSAARVFFSGRDINLLRTTNNRELIALYGYRATGNSVESQGEITETTLFQFPTSQTLNSSPDHIVKSGMQIGHIGGDPDNLAQFAFVHMAERAMVFIPGGLGASINAHSSLQPLFWKLAPPEFVDHYLHHIRHIAINLKRTRESGHPRFENLFGPATQQAFTAATKLSKRAMQVALEVQGSEQYDLASLFAGFYSVPEALKGTEFDREPEVASGPAEKFASALLGRVAQVRTIALATSQTRGQSFSDITAVATL